MSARSLVAALAAGLALAPGRADAQFVPSSSLPAMQAAGRIVLVQFRSDSSRACLLQDEALGRIARDKTSWVPAVVQVDLDQEGELKERYRIKAPATLVLLSGTMEMARVGELQTEEQIRQFIGIWTSKARGVPRRRAKRELRPKH